MHKILVYSHILHLLKSSFVLVYLYCLFSIANLDDWLTVRRSITLVHLQLDAQNSCLFIYNTFIIRILINILYVNKQEFCASSWRSTKVRPYMFRSPLKPSSGGPWPYFVRLLNWNVDLHLL